MGPPFRYARNGNVSIAYQIVGDGPHDLLAIPGWVSHLALDWEEPAWVRWIERLTRFARVVRFDKRGTGLSDRPAGIPTPDERMEDARAVMDEVGLERAHVFGWSEGGPLAVMLAVTHPERVQSLVLYGTQATFRRRDDYPFAFPEDAAMYDDIERTWGDPQRLDSFVPGGDERTITRLAAYRQAAASPAAAAALARANGQIDVRGLLKSIRVPTLVVNRSDDPVAPAPAGAYLAARIPDARFVELPGAGHTPWFGDVEPLVTEIEHFVTGIRPAERTPGVVRAVLQCDVEGSTPLARRLGDERWADVLAEYGRAAARAVETFGGRVVDQVGDGLMATFEGPVAAIRAARRLQARARSIGVAVRAGVHLGEVVEDGDAVRGIAVHLAARVMAQAAGGEVVVSGTVRDVVAGSGLDFVDRGLYELKGIEGERRLFAVV